MSDEERLARRAGTQAQPTDRTPPETAVALAASFHRLRVALEDGSDAALLASEFRRAVADEDFRLETPGVGLRPRGTLSAAARRRWATSADIESVLWHLTMGRGSREVAWVIGDVAGPESLPALEALATTRHQDRPMVAAACHAMADIGGPRAAAALARRLQAAMPDETPCPPDVPPGQWPSRARYALDALRRLACADSENPEASRCPSTNLVQAVMDGAFAGGPLELPATVLTSLIRSRQPEHDFLRLLARICLEDIVAQAEWALLGSSSDTVRIRTTQA